MDRCIVVSLPFEIAPPVTKAPPILFRILNSINAKRNLSNQLSKKIFISPAMFA
jgi:outer membrane immunogenic protein